MLRQASPHLVLGRQLARPIVDPALVRQLAAALLAAALLETVLLRPVTRIGVHLPRDEAVSSAIQASSFFVTSCIHSARASQ